jgi:hypothetical protein
MTRTGKIARLPVAVREEVNRRLLDGEPGSKILPWLNGLEAVLRILDEHFGEEPITPQNLSEWRQGGYADWLARREKIAATKELAGYAARLGAAAGGDLTEGGAAILGGKLLEALEGATEGEELRGLADVLVALRRTDLEARKARQRDTLLEQNERKVSLSEKQFEARSCELFIEWAKNKQALDIAQGPEPKAVQMEQLHLLIFGRPPADERSENLGARSEKTNPPKF